MILALLLGCTGGDFSAFVPTVKFQRLDLTSIDFERINVDFVFDIDNPNPVDIPLSSFSYALGFEGVEVLSGSDPDGLKIGSEGTSELALPIGIDFANIFEAATATRGLDYIGFGLQGNFGFDTDLGPVAIEFDEEGSFPALRLPKFDLGQLRIESASDSEVGIGLDVSIDNDLGSTLDFSNLDFTMKVAGVRLGGGTMANVDEVPGASSKTVTIPLSVNFEDAANALGEVADGEQITLELDALMDVDTPFGVLPLSVDERGDVELVDETSR